jgi:hypothetical protein
VWPSPNALTRAEDKPWIQEIARAKESDHAALEAGAAGRFASIMENRSQEIKFLKGDLNEFDTTIAVFWNMLLPNAAGMHGLEMAEGYFTFVSALHLKILRQVFTKQPRLMYKMMSVRYLLYLQPGGKPNVMLSANSMPFAFFPGTLEFFPTEDAILQRILSGDWNPSESLLLEEANTKPAVNPSGKVLRVAKRWDELEVRYNAPVGAWLTLNETFDRQWRASDDRGVALPIVKADGHVMAVKIANGGEGVITFRFSEPYLAAGIWLFLAWLLLFFFCWARSAAGTPKAKSAA